MRFLLATVEHARPFHVYVPREGGMNGRGGGRPVPAREDVAEGVILRKGGPFRLITHKTLQLPSVGKAPIPMAAGPLPIHGRDIIERLLPEKGEFREIGVPGPFEPREAIQDRIPSWFEPRKGHGIPLLSSPSCPVPGHAISRPFRS